ncbi:hypothetical protein M2336_001025 [Sphingobium sp. B1D7B]|nr:hypothetical protein [Sphingobium sp. B1D7B]
MRIFSLILGALYCSLASGLALASDQVAKVNAAGADSLGGPAAFLLSGSRSGKPSCATDDAWAIPQVPSDNAKALLSLVLTAFATDKAVQVVGSGTCPTDAATREAVAWIWMTK